MDIKLSEDNIRKRFYIEKGGIVEAEMFFQENEGKYILIEHTEVNPLAEGRGLGKALVNHAINYVKEKNIKIIPVCPFAKAVIEKNPDYRQLIYK